MRKMKLMGCNEKSVQQHGFTLLELMVSVTILSIVAGVVVSGLTSLVQRNQMETTKVDFIQLNPLNGPCPCIIQRGTITKAQFQAGTIPFYYTEVNNVNNVNVFQGYDNAGNNVPLAGAPVNNLAAIEITLNVQSPFPDSNRIFPTITMSTGVKIHNFN